MSSAKTRKRTRRKKEKKDVGTILDEIAAELKRVKEQLDKEYAKKYSQYVSKHLGTENLQSILIIDFILPSVDILSRTEPLDTSGKEEKRVRLLDPEDIKVIPRLRNKFYDALKFNGAFQIASHTWAVLPGFEGKIVEEINKIINEFNKILAKYGIEPREVKLVEIFAPYGWVVRKIAETIKEYSSTMREKFEKMKKEELDERSRKIIESELNKYKRMLEPLRIELNYLLDLKREAETRPEEEHEEATPVTESTTEETSESLPLVPIKKRLKITWDTIPEEEEEKAPIFETPAEEHEEENGESLSPGFGKKRLRIKWDI